MQTQNIVYVALFAAIIAALGLLPPMVVPLIGVPITAQSMGPMLAGGILGAKRGGLAVLLFLTLVAVGMPLLAGGRGGLGIFMGPSGGFLLGFFPAAVVVGAFVQCPDTKTCFKSLLISCFIGGVLLVYAMGVPWMVMMTDISWSKALQGTAAFLPGDIIKVFVAASVAQLVRSTYPRAINGST